MIAILCIALVSCGAVRSGYNKCLDDIREDLLNPDTLKVKSASCITTPDGECAYKIEYTAKNAFNSYVNSKTAYYLYDPNQDELSEGYSLYNIIQVAYNANFDGYKYTKIK